MTEDNENLVVVTTMAGESLVGYTGDKVKFSGRVNKGDYVTLRNVRAFVNERFPKPTQQGLTLDSFCAFLPLGVFRGPATKVSCRVATFYFPAEQDDKDLLRKMQDLITAAENSETSQRAGDAGLYMPGSMT